MLWWLSPGEGWDVVGINCKRAQRLKMKAQVSSIWAKGCILVIWCVLSNLTRLPILSGWRKSWYIINLLYFFSFSHLSVYRLVLCGWGIWTVRV